MASLGWVTPGAATEGVTPLLFPEKPGDLFLVASSAVSPLFILFSKTDDLFFAHRCRYHYHFLLLSLECHSSRGCHPAVFLLVRPCFSTILCKFVHKKISFRYHPWSEFVVPAPPSDATVFKLVQTICSPDRWLQVTVVCYLKYCSTCPVILYAGQQLSVHLWMLFNALLTQSFIHSNLCKGIIVPLLKAWRCNTARHVERNPTLSLVLSKLYEMVLLHLSEEFRVSDDLQFGVKSITAAHMPYLLLVNQ